MKTVFKGEIGGISYRAEAKDKKEFIQVERDIKALLKRTEMVSSAAHKSQVDVWREKSRAFKAELDLLKRQLKAKRGVELEQTFRRIIDEEIRRFKDWEIKDRVAESFGWSNVQTALKEAVEKILKEKKVVT